MAVGDVHTVPYGGRWANLVEGDEEVSNIFDSRTDASAAGARMAEVTGADHHVHDVAGPGPAGGAG